MRYLVTGSAGFIGWKVAELLLRAGAEVVGLDDLNPAYDVRLKQWRLESLKTWPRFRFFQADITQQDPVEEIFSAFAGQEASGTGNPPGRQAEPGSQVVHLRQERTLSLPEGQAGQRLQVGPPKAQTRGSLSERPAKPGSLPPTGDLPPEWQRRRAAPFDAVVHLAARAGVRASVLEPDVFLRTNGLGTLVLLEACRRHRVQKFLLASTSALYGAHNPTPYREDADTSRPLSPYAASKKAAECLAYTYHYLYGLDVVVLRYFTVYGPAGRPDMSVFRFIRQIAEGQPVLVYGDGSQQRDFTYVEDVARGTVAALELRGFEIINLGSDRPVSVLKLIEQIERLVGRQARVEYRPAQPADVPATWADIRRAKEKLGWTPQTTLEQGLAQTVAWYQQHRSWAARIDLGQ